MKVNTDKQLTKDFLVELVVQVVSKIKYLRDDYKELFEPFKMFLNGDLHKKKLELCTKLIV